MEENNRPILTIVAGPNGSGKSTLVNLLLEGEHLGVFINADVIVSNISKRKGEAIASVETQWEAAIAAEEMRWSLLGQKVSFIGETVMSDVDRWFRFLSAAKEAGFFITLVYVSTISPDVNINRV
jgi:predicted ABC-type ATPase